METFSAPPANSQVLKNLTALLADPEWVDPIEFADIEWIEHRQYLVSHIDDFADCVDPQ